MTTDERNPTSPRVADDERSSLPTVDPVEASLPNPADSPVTGPATVPRVPTRPAECDEPSSAAGRETALASATRVPRDDLPEEATDDLYVVTEDDDGAIFEGRWFSARAESFRDLTEAR